MMSSNKRVYLITGANAGLGFKASLDLALQPNTHVIMTGRSLERVNAAAERVRAAIVNASPSPSSSVETALLDLSSLDSVRNFCASLQAHSPPLTDLIVLANAGVNTPTKTLTTDGFELTFGVNHLGHFLLVTMLPGFTPDTSLSRHSSFDPVKMTAICKERGIPTSTTEVSGAFMAQLCSEPDWSTRGWATGMFLCVNEPFHTSEQAKDPKLAHELWELSVALAGVNQP